MSASNASGKKAGNKNVRSLIGLVVVAIIVVAALLAGRFAFGKQDETAKTVVKVGIVTEADNQVWDKVNEILDKEGKNIKVETVTFQGGSGLANQAVDDGEIDLNAFQNKNFFATQVKTNGYKLSAIGDLYISRLNLYSDKYTSPDQIPDGAKIAIPNNPANGGHALEVLQQAGLLTVTKPSDSQYPTKNDITDNPKNLVIDEVDVNQIPNLLKDYDAGVINVYAVLDHDMDPTKDAIFNPDLDYKGKDSQWVNVLVARTADKDKQEYKDVLAAYQTKEVAEVLNSQFKNGYVPAFEY
ncbi:MetQ/NlpA family ABC transporter substrate-binding protein [Bifidobacterium amazonense]|uniref:MetQ/NlpA family ABC transporter substrate-binding protein n=1 Tax=Bifidobacterium amazonense TaxID=2809027 RepID=A0ABS9VS52_9BIFI|nr:MetQ/NlpA family ABC transporter substrate-binding protein [Bifidobacterium amazonense]MCH9274908.1 MetQ/NlpA family ABC transporter substrate-binding protein [Bifidobacterium amazonense]